VGAPTGKGGRRGRKGGGEKGKEGNWTEGVGRKDGERGMGEREARRKGWEGSVTEKCFCADISLYVCTYVREIICTQNYAKQSICVSLSLSVPMLIFLTRFYGNALFHLQALSQMHLCLCRCFPYE
jgi:hypothetical protein